MKVKRLYAAPSVKMLQIRSTCSFLAGSGIKAMRNNYDKDIEEWED